MYIIILKETGINIISLNLNTEHAWISTKATQNMIIKKKKLNCQAFGNISISIPNVNLGLSEDFDDSK